MLDPATASPAGLPNTPQSAGGKRIPASLMKMRRESFATSGKYKLPTVSASALPDNSLAGMATKLRTSTTAALPAFCTPMRHTPKTLKICLDQATGMLSKPELDLAGEPAKRISDFSRGSNHSGVGSIGSRASLRRTKSVGPDDDIGNGFTAKDMDSLVRSGLATPRRARRSFRVPATGTLDKSSSHSANKRMSRLRQQNKTDAMGGSSSQDSTVGGATGAASRRIRRSKSLMEENVPITPRRSSGRRGSNGVRRCATFDAKTTRSTTTTDGVTHRLSGSLDTSVTSTSCSDISDRTPAAVEPQAWKCTCGEEHPMECKFCGMCGAKQRWECADCGYANKCKFKFCGVCGIAKRVKGED